MDPTRSASRARLRPAEEPLDRASGLHLAGVQEGDVLTVRLAGSSIVLTPAVVTPIELYTDERIAEFDQSAQLSESELEAARRAWTARRRRR